MHIIMYPTDTIKKNLQINNSKQKYKGLYDCTHTIYKNNGIKGFRLNFIKTIPQVAIKFTSYDLIKFYL